MARLRRQELVELIESMEASGGDATDMKALLADVDSDAQKRRATGNSGAATPSHRGLQSTRDEEMTTQEYLEYKVGDLFPEGITEEILEKLFEMDRDHSLKELKSKCAEEGLSTSGDKKILAAKLLAHRRK